MQRLNLPTYLFNTKLENDRTYIFDNIRRKYLLLTPEEWVRQNFIQYLIAEKKVPPALISVEKALKINKLTKRTDILIHNREGKVCTIIECKAPEVNLTSEVFDQILRYNISYLVPFIIITNGLNHYCCQLNYQTGQYQFLKEIPEYKQLCIEY